MERKSYATPWEDFNRGPTTVTSISWALLLMLDVSSLTAGMRCVLASMSSSYCGAGTKRLLSQRPGLGVRDGTIMLGFEE